MPSVDAKQRRYFKLKTFIGKAINKMLFEEHQQQPASCYQFYRIIKLSTLRNASGNDLINVAHHHVLEMTGNWQVFMALYLRGCCCSPSL